MRRRLAASCLILCLSLAACAARAANDARGGARPARPAEAPSAPDDYARAGRWLRLGLFDYINPERGLVLRISEMPDGTYDAWGVYVIDLRAGTSEPLCRLDERIAKSGKEGPSSLYLRASGLWLSLKKDRLWIHALEGGKEGPTSVPVSVLYEIELPGGKLKRLQSRSDAHAWTHGWYYGSGWSINGDEQHVVYPLRQDAKAMLFERVRLDGTGAKEVLSLPSANMAQMYPLAFARNGTCLASQFVQSQQLYCVRPGNARPEVLKGPPERSVFRAEPDHTGLGFLAVTNSSPHLGYDFRSESELWSFAPGRKEAWQKHALLPATHSAYAGWAFGWGGWGGTGGICPASDGKRAYMVQSQLRMDRRDDNDVPAGYSLNYSHNGWGLGHGDGRFSVFEVNLENGEVKALWTRHDLERAFYAKREPAAAAGGGDGLEIGRAER